MKIPAFSILFFLSFALYGQNSYFLYVSDDLLPSDSSNAKYIRSVKQLNDSLYGITDKRVSDGMISLTGTIIIDYSKVHALVEFNYKGRETGITNASKNYDRRYFEGRHLRHGEFIEFHDNGIIKSRGTYFNNKKSGDFHYYYESGKIKEVLRYDDSIESFPEYLVISYFDSLGTQLVIEGNGTYNYSSKIIDIETGTIRNGYKHGLWTGRFFGKYDFEELFEDGNFISGITTDSNGNSYLYNQLEIQARYEGGMENLYKYIGSKLKYPVKARRQGLQGSVYIEFVVDKDGNTTDVKVLKGFNRECDEQALRLVESADNFIPGKFKGVTTKQRMVLPITFTL